MKQLLLLVFLFFGWAAQAQNSLLFKTRPPAFLVGTPEIVDGKFGDYMMVDLFGVFNAVGFEKVFEYGSSIQLMGGYYNMGNFKGFEAKGFSLMPEYRYYFKKNAPKGMYCGMHMMYTQLEFGAKLDYAQFGGVGELKVKTDANFMASGLTIGTQFSLFRKNGLTDIFIGAQYRGSVVAVEAEYSSLPPEAATMPQLSKPFHLMAGFAMSYYLFD